MWVSVLGVAVGVAVALVVLVAVRLAVAVAVAAAAAMGLITVTLRILAQAARTLTRWLSTLWDWEMTAKAPARVLTLHTNVSRPGRSPSLRERCRISHACTRGRGGAAASVVVVISVPIFRARIVSCLVVSVPPVRTVSAGWAGFGHEPLSGF